MRCVLVLLALLLSSGTATGALLQGQEPSGPFCNRQDDSFVRTFDWIALMTAGCFLFVAVPYLAGLIPMNKWSWTDPRKRWLYLSVSLFGLFVLVFWFLPFGALHGWVSPSLGFSAYQGVDPDYVRCGQTDFGARGLLFSSIDTDRRAAISYPWLLLELLSGSFVVWSIVYYTTYLGFRRFFGLARNVR